MNIWTITSDFNKDKTDKHYDTLSNSSKSGYSKKIFDKLEKLENAKPIRKMFQYFYNNVSKIYN